MAYVRVGNHHYDVAAAQIRAVQRELAALVMASNPALHELEGRVRDEFLQALPPWALRQLLTACLELTDRIYEISQERTWPTGTSAN